MKQITHFDHSISDVTLSEMSVLNILAKKLHLQSSPVITLAPDSILLFLLLLSIYEYMFINKTLLAVSLPQCKFLQGKRLSNG